jgi:Arc/MetJ family transcription regulator
MPKPHTSGMLNGMPRLKTTVSIDEQSLRDASELLGLTSTSEVVDVALERLVQSERLLRDLRAYLGRPPTAEEAMFGRVPVRFDLDDDDVDYEALYGAP